MPRYLKGRQAAFIAGAIALGLAAAAFWPTVTRVGVNYEVTEHRLPLWRKAWNFLERDANTRRLARSIAGEIDDPGARAVAVLDWTVRNIRSHPRDVRVVDDHVWSIIERGYGSNDQQADVFTTLLTYAGVRAYWTLIGPERPEFPLSLVLIDGRWRVFDVERGIAFRDSSGALLSVSGLERSRDIAWLSAQNVVSDREAYLRWFTGFRAATPPDVLRAEMQMPGKRLRYELGRRFRLRQ